MKIAYFSVVLNIHQVHIADELYELTNHDFVFVELIKPEDLDKKGGKSDYSSRPYLLQSWIDEEHKLSAKEIAETAEVAVFGGYMALEFQKARLKRGLLTFEMGERWIKHWQSMVSPRLLSNLWYHFSQGWYKKPLYKLCSSAYGARDQYRLHTFKNRCYKWGYFTEVPIVYKPLNDNSSGEFSIMWCARFIGWKHPELAIKLARRLKDNDYKAQIDLYGIGVELEQIKEYSKKLDVLDCVFFKGSVPNEEILDAMRRHDIFIFTSDHNEGWGVVLNEAMGNGCAVVASNEIGSVPYLIKDYENGLTFKSGSVDSLYEKVSYLLDNPAKIKQMSSSAYKTIKDIWSPRQAAINFMALIDGLEKGKDISIKEGPCSKALPL